MSTASPSFTNYSRIDDLEVVRAQLGRSPRTAFSVVSRCPAGHPRVIRCYPLCFRKGNPEPFPTLYWLTCPNLVAKISHAEAAGWIAALTKRLAESVDDMQRMRDAHEQYIAQRWALLTAEDRNTVEAAGLDALFQRCGIGGTADWRNLKCLHAHYAYHLVQPTVVGAWMEELFEMDSCAE